MDLATTLPSLLAFAWLLPLASFVIVWLFGPRLGPAGKHAGYVATGAILGSFVLSLIALVSWTGTHGVFVAGHHDEVQAAAEGADHHDDHAHEGHDHADHDHAGHDHEGKAYYTGDWYTLAKFGNLKLTIGYYIDSLTLVMFCMVTLIASCIHFYSQGYMHDELHDFEDHEVTLADGHHLHRRGRYHRFFQYLSLFCFSMLGIVVAGNMAMVFVFWELVGVCSYFLIGFYIERKSASTAANKAFIVNRVGDFGMLIGMMALWSSLGTFNFGDMPVVSDATGNEATGHAAADETQVQPGIFSQVRHGSHHKLDVPDGMKKAAVAMGAEDGNRCGYWLLVIAGVGIFCGCVGKSAQFPLHTWLPDAMEGPTPVSALVHSATMVAAGVYLAGRFYPVFAPEVLLVIAIIGCITLFMAATIAITAVDIKRVLAYSTVSQLGYMMFALGVGGWVAGMLHLITHAFFKSLLFMCSGSVIHAVHTNDMTKMGGLRKKMPWTAYTMLVGCLAISGAGIPFLVGFSGYYSKDSIIAQAIAYKDVNPLWGVMLFVAVGGAAITAFYMFRLWYMTFSGQPRDAHKYDHAHESPKVMYYPLVLLSVFAVAVAWPISIVGDANHATHGSPLIHMLNQAVPDGVGSMEAAARGTLVASVAVPSEHASHEDRVHTTATIMAFSTALGGFLLATIFYGWRYLDPAEVRSQFSRTYRFLWNKWWFDELYDALFVKPTHLVGGVAAWLDKNVLDRIIDGTAKVTLVVSRYDDWFDRLFVDGLVNSVARWTYGFGAALRGLQTGRLRQYAMFVVLGTVVLFVLLSFFLGNVAAGK
ncbi:MAG: NADH-quinone oxidoreductase subunit L [Pirellulales bacterium]